MAQDPLKPRDNGQIGMPRIDAGMNKLPPVSTGGATGAKDDDSQRLTASEVQVILTRARKRFELAQGAETDNRAEALKDLKFKAGEQWPSDIVASRQFDGRPTLTVNKIPTFVHQVTNEQRQNRPTINVNAVGERADVQAAQIYRGLIRAIERKSFADVAYDTAFESAVSNGFGYWRILTDFQSSDTFDQEIVVRRIRNPFAVYMDPAVQEPDASDARFCFISEMVPRDEFKERYPDAQVTPWNDAGVGDKASTWATRDGVRIAEYFDVVHEERTLIALSNGHVGWDDELHAEVRDAIKGGTIEVLRRRSSRVPTVKWHKITALEVLESRDWAGAYIPVVRVIGNEIDIEGKVKLSGLIRNARDAQRMYNYAATAEIEATALAPKAPFVMAEGQAEGYEEMWKQANSKNYATLFYRPVPLPGGGTAPPPQRQPPVPPQAAWIQVKMGAAQDMIATTGIRFDATMNERMTDESGVAVKELRRNTDVGNYHYIDNFSRALRRTGEILIDMIPRVYDTRRVLTILREDDGEEQIILDPAQQQAVMRVVHERTQKVMRAFNPTVGEYGVTVTIGPSYATKRIEAGEQMMAFARAMPQIAANVADLIVKNQDWPGAEEFATRLAKLLPPGLLTPDMKDVSPQLQALLSQMQQQLTALMQQRQQMMLALNDKQADRALAAEKINRDFAAKLLAILQKSDAAQPSPIDELHSIATAATEFDRLMAPRQQPT